MRRQLFDQAGECQVEEHVARFGIADDEAHLIGKQPGIDRVQHGAAAGDAEIDLQMPVVVPRQRGDPLTLRNAQPAQCVGNPPGTRCDRAPGAAMDRTLDRAGHDLGAGMVALRIVEQRRNQQRALLHQSEHESPSPPGPLGIAPIRPRIGARIKPARFSLALPGWFPSIVATPPVAGPGPAHPGRQQRPRHATAAEGAYVMRTPRRVSRRRALQLASASAALPLVHIRTAGAAGKLTFAMWDHWVPTGNDAVRKVVDAWAQKNKVEVKHRFPVHDRRQDRHHHGGRSAGPSRPRHLRVRSVDRAPMVRQARSDWTTWCNR